MTLQETLDNHTNSYPTHISTPKTEELNLTASFVIPVFNSAQSIGHTMAAIANLERVDLIREIVLIDDGSDDNSLEVMQELVHKFSYLNIVVLNNTIRRYSAYARNRGIEECTGDLVFFIDSDIILPSDYLVQHTWQHQTIGSCITFSLRKNVRDIKDVQFPIDRADGDFRASILSDNTLHDKPFRFCDTHTLAEMCLTCAVTYRRTDLELTKGCPENFRGWGYNDTAMAAKVIALGRPVVPIAWCMVYHLEHAPRSGATSKKWAEFEANKKRYQRLLELPIEETFNYAVVALEA